MRAISVATILAASIISGCSDTEKPKEPSATPKVDAEKKPPEQTAEEKARDARIVAAFDLIKKDPQAKEAIPGLIEALNSSNFYSRVEAARILGSFGPAAASAAPTLRDMLKSKGSNIRFAAALALARIEPADTSGVSEIVEGFKLYSDADVVSGSREALIAIGPPAIPELKKSLSHKDVGVVLGVTRLLPRLGPKAAPVLITVLSDQNYEVRRIAVEGLGELGPAAKEAVPVLVAELNAAEYRRGRDVSGFGESESVKERRRQLKSDYLIAASRALEQIDPQAAEQRKKKKRTEKSDK